MQKSVTGNTTAQNLGTAPEHKKALPRSIIIDNRTTGNKTLIFRDVFTTDASNGAVAASVSRIWLVLDVNQNTGAPNPVANTILKGDDLKGIELLGAFDVSSNITDASLNITCAFDHV